MKKIQPLFFICCFLLIVILLFRPSQVKADPTVCETRAVWLNPRAFNEQMVRQTTLNSILQANLNTVFLASYPLVNQYGWNHGWCVPERNGCDKTDFEEMLRMLKDNRISTHVWITNRFRDGSNQADFTNPQELVKQKQWALDWLARNPDLDGVHFDYIRYISTWETPGSSWSDFQIDRNKTEAISSLINEAHREISSQYGNKFLTAAVYSNVTAETIWSAEFSPTWFSQWKAANPGNIYQTSNAPEFLKVQQDPVSWVANRMIDAVIPMEYLTDDNNWNLRLDHWISFINFTQGNLEQVYMGLGYYNDANLNYSHPDAAAVVRKINSGRAKGVKSFSIFQMGDANIDDGPMVAALKNGPFSQATPTCLGTANPPLELTETSSPVGPTVVDEYTPVSVPFMGIKLGPFQEPYQNFIQILEVLFQTIRQSFPN